jgi:branched-chain amino acid transport system substrate-binding protein
MKRRRLLLGSATLGAFGWSAPVVAEPSGVSPTEIVLGHTGVLTGPLGGPVKAMLAGAELAFADLKAAGGVNGRTIRLVSIDDELKPDKAVANYEKLLADPGVFAFFGCVGSGTTAAAAPVLARSGAALVGGFAVADSAREKVKGSGYFLRATTGREAQALIQQLTTIGVTKISVAHLDNPGGQEALSLIQQAMATHQLKPAAAVGVKGDASNAADAAKHLATDPPQAIIMYLGGPLGGELMKATWALGSNPMFYGMSIVPGELTAKIIGARARGLAISQVVPYPWAEVDPVARDFRRLAEAAKVTVGYYSYEGYLSALLMIEALRRTGRDLTRPKLHASLRSLKFRLANMDVDFATGNSTGSRFVELVQVTAEGRFVR